MNKLITNKKIYLNDYISDINYSKYDFVFDALYSRRIFFEKSKKIKDKQSKMDKIDNLLRVYNTSNNSFEKYISYKDTPCDPDSYSKLLQEIYNKLWGDLFYGKNFMKPYKKNIFCSDTLTSAQRRINDQLNSLKKDITINALNKDVIYSQKQIIDSYKQNDDFRNFVNNDSKLESLREFLSVYHTLGNYCPVPNGFNVARSGSYADKDYVDLMLIKIKEYYDSKDINQSINNAYKTLIELLNHKDIFNCKLWLDCFDGWKDFVDKNFFKGNFVNDKYEVELLCNKGNRNWKNHHIPDNEYDIFYRNTTEKIKKRTETIIKALTK